MDKEIEQTIDGEHVELEEYRASTISADFLANFMRERWHLEKIIKEMAFTPRYNAEHIEYLGLFSGETAISRLVIPMTCFCDIKLHQISYHAEGSAEGIGYGKFAIIMKKEWGVRNGVQPVLYVTEKSILKKQITKSFNLYFEAIEKNCTNSLLDNTADVLYDQIRFIKPLSGDMPIGNSIVTKNFTDEQEWRFIPNISEDIARGVYYDPLDGLKTSFKGIELENEAISKVKEAKLKFEVTDVKYIFVETDEDSDEIINFIMSPEINTLSQEEKIKLIQKIIVYNDSRGDF